MMASDAIDAGSIPAGCIFYFCARRERSVSRTLIYIYKLKQVNKVGYYGKEEAEKSAEPDN